MSKYQILPSGPEQPAPYASASNTTSRAPVAQQLPSVSLAKQPQGPLVAKQPSGAPVAPRDAFVPAKNPALSIEDVTVMLLPAQHMAPRGRMPLAARGMVPLCGETTFAGVFSVPADSSDAFGGSHDDGEHLLARARTGQQASAQPASQRRFFDFDTLFGERPSVDAPASAARASASMAPASASAARASAPVALAPQASVVGVNESPLVGAFCETVNAAIAEVILLHGDALATNGAIDGQNLMALAVMGLLRTDSIVGPDSVMLIGGGMLSYDTCPLELRQTLCALRDIKPTLLELDGETELTLVSQICSRPQANEFQDDALLDVIFALRDVAAQMCAMPQVRRGANEVVAALGSTQTLIW